MRREKVVILGGGVAGMSAAHELIERGFEVDIYELRATPGGKARSIPVPNTATDGRQPLPGEHGFRFFPHFYKHLVHTMRHIPYGDKTVADNLVETSEMHIARWAYANIVSLSRFPTTWRELKTALHSLSQFLYHSKSLGLWPGEVEAFGAYLWQILTTCAERRLEEYDSIGWWEFIEAERHSPAYQELFGDLSRTLVAAQPCLMSAKTAGDTLVQLLLDIFVPGTSTDCVLNGPTSTAWLYPWLAHLLQRGVRYHINTRVQAINCDQERILSVTIAPQGSAARVLACDKHGITQTVPLPSGAASFDVSGDFYLAALPLEVMVALVTKDMLTIDPTLDVLSSLKTNLGSMNGILFYLKRDIPVVHGHTNHSGSPWALTSVSQQQFWPDIDLSQYGDGNVKGILSVVISDWQKAGICDQAAEDCLDAKTFQAEVWAQLKTSLNSHGEEILKDNDLYTCFMADEVIVRRPNDAGQEKLVTQEPLLINQRNTWHLRPEAFTRIDNLFLASDYVRTNTDLATMEAANEAARRAVNCIIDRVNHQRLFFKRLSYCKIWTLHEPYCLWYWRRRDYRRNQRGLPWDGKIGILSKMTLFLLKILLLIVMKIVVKPYSESDSHETTQRV